MSGMRWRWIPDGKAARATGPQDLSGSLRCDGKGWVTEPKLRRLYLLGPFSSSDKSDRKSVAASGSNDAIVIRMNGHISILDRTAATQQPVVLSKQATVKWGDDCPHHGPL
jgi:hypothetical protein